MTTTSTLGAIIQQLVAETGIGFVIPSYTGTTTTLTLTNSYLENNGSGARFPKNAPIIVTSTTGLGDMTYLSNYVASTGVITVNPAITTSSTDAVLIYPDKGIDHPNRIMEAINRAILNRVIRLQQTPLTFVPDGDLMGTTVTDYWTGTAATPTYVTPTFPTAGAANFGFTSVQRVLQSVTSNATNSVKSNLINVALNPTVTGYQWYFQTAIRVVSGSGNAQIYAYDETNGAAITANVIAGDNQTHVTNSLGFINMTGTLNIPATCKQITFRLVSSATTTTIQMTPLVAYPVDAVSFPLPNRILNPDYVGNFHYGTPVSGTSGPYSVAMSEPITTSGRTHHFSQFGDHMTVTFNFRPVRPVYFDEWFGESSLSTLSSASTFYLDHIVKWAKYELFKYLYVAEPQRVRDTRYGSVPVPSAWKVKAIEAKREAEYSEYEQDAITVYGRV